MVVEGLGENMQPVVMLISPLQEQQRREQAERDEFNSKVTRRMHPRNKEDFDLLYHGLEGWLPRKGHFGRDFFHPNRIPPPQSLEARGAGQDC